MGRGGREDPPDLAKSTILTVYLRHYFNALYLTPSPSSPSSLPPPTYLVVASRDYYFVKRTKLERLRFNKYYKYYKTINPSEINGKFKKFEGSIVDDIIPIFVILLTNFEEFYILYFPRSALEFEIF